MNVPERSVNHVVIVPLLLSIVFGLAADAARAQNDWQFPDPYFGAVEFGRSNPGPAAERRYRAEVDPSVRPTAPGFQRRALDGGPPRTRAVRPHRLRGRRRG